MTEASASISTRVQHEEKVLPENNEGDYQAALGRHSTYLKGRTFIVRVYRCRYVKVRQVALGAPKTVWGVARLISEGDLGEGEAIPKEAHRTKLGVQR